jgi:hypothetical protein
MEHTVGVLFDYYDDDTYLYSLDKLVTSLKQEVGTRIIKHERPPIGSRYRICVDFRICYKVEQTPTEED